jgi:hypothetical protein
MLVQPLRRLSRIGAFHTWELLLLVLEEASSTSLVLVLYYRSWW